MERLSEIPIKGGLRNILRTLILNGDVGMLLTSITTFSELARYEKNHPNKLWEIAFSIFFPEYVTDDKGGHVFNMLFTKQKNYRKLTLWLHWAHKKVLTLISKNHKYMGFSFVKMADRVNINYFQVGNRILTRQQFASEYGFHKGRLLDIKRDFDKGSGDKHFIDMNVKRWFLIEDIWGYFELKDESGYNQDVLKGIEKLFGGGDKLPITVPGGLEFMEIAMAACEILTYYELNDYMEKMDEKHKQNWESIPDAPRLSGTGIIYLGNNVCITCKTKQVQFQCKKCSQQFCSRICGKNHTHK